MQRRTSVSEAPNMSLPPTSTVVSKRASQQLRRKPVPIATVDVDIASISEDPRYPPFDSADPFAPLAELRRRSYTIAPDQTCSAGAPFDLPGASPIIFPSGRRYTLTVAKPRSLPDLLSPFEKIPPSDVEFADDPSTLGGREGECANDLSYNGREGKGIGIYEDKRSLSKKHQNQNLLVNQRRHSHSSLLSRITPSTQSDVAPKKAHYIPRKASQLGRMYTPPLTPDLSVSGSSSSNSEASLLEMMAGTQSSSVPRASAVHDTDVSPPKRSKSPAAAFVRRLLPRRSAGNLVPPRQDHEDLPPVPTPPSSSTLRPRPDDVPSIPFPRTSAFMDISMDVSPSRPPLIGSSTSQQTLVAEADGYQTEPELLSRRALTDQDLGVLDAAFSPPRQRTRYLSFNSRSILKAKADINTQQKAKSVSTHARGPAVSVFSEHVSPTPEQLQRAAATLIVAESGVRIRFGDLWDQGKTIVVFIRHFRAILCQDYVRSLTAEVELNAFDKAGYKVIIVGLGSHTMINSYRQITGTRFPIYTDPTLTVHRALGMTFKASNSSENYHSTVGGFYKSLKEAVSFRMPLFDRGGDISQLGGEFVLGPGPTCTYAHRMKNAQSHAPISAILSAAGVPTAVIDIKPERDLAPGRQSSVPSIEDEEAWMARRRRSLARMRRKRQSRRAGTAGPNAGIGSGWTDGIHFEEVKERFPILEEEDEYDASLEKRLELQIEN